MTLTTLAVCRGCCCGVQPDRAVAAEDALARLTAAAREHDARVQVTDCLGLCEGKDIVVVRRKDVPRDQKLLWFAGVDQAHVLDELCAWITDGGEFSETLEDAVVDPPRGEQITCEAEAFLPAS